MTGRLIILSGPSGVGKDTVIEHWREVNPKVERVVATTTRPPRDGEADGIDYDFVSKEEFESLVRQGAFLEHKQVHGNFYATPAKSVERLLLDGKIAILKIDVQGALDVMGQRSDALSIFLLPPSFDVLEKRIRGRGTDPEAVIQKRLADARFEISQADKYAYRVVNDDLDLAVRQLQEIVNR